MGPPSETSFLPLGWFFAVVRIRAVSSEHEGEDEGAALGTYDWRTWSDEELSVDGRDGKVVSLAVGRLRQSGRGVLYPESRQVQNGRQTSRAIRILFYDVPR